jgi:hypothetical protein
MLAHNLLKQRLTVGVFPYNPDSDDVAFALSVLLML